MDILGATIFRWTPSSDVIDSVSFDFEFLPLATPSCETDAQFIASGDTVYTYRWGQPPDPLVTLPVGEEARLNDGIVDADGCLWIGSMGSPPNLESPQGKLWRVTSDGRFKQVLSGIGISNGIAWADKRRGYYVDSLSRSVDTLTLTGESLMREPWLVIDPPGEPDGLLVSEGFVFIAIWDGGEIVRANIAAGESSRIPVPTARPSSVALSTDLVLVTAAGNGSGTDLDQTGTVLTCALADFIAY